jgi:hypothetical protein
MEEARRRSRQRQPHLAFALLASQYHGNGRDDIVGGGAGFAG